MTALGIFRLAYKPRGSSRLDIVIPKVLTIRTCWMNVHTAGIYKMGLTPFLKYVLKASSLI